MGYEMRSRSDGQVEVVELRPVVLGTFAQAEHAEAFRSMLAAREGQAEEALTAVPAQVDGATCRDDAHVGLVAPTPAAWMPSTRAGAEVRADAPAVERAEMAQPASASTPEDRPATDPVRSEPVGDAVAATEPPQPVRPVATGAVPMTLAKPEFDRAAVMQRLDAGESLIEVAASIGMNWSSLRGHYANHRRYNPVAVSSGEQSNCRICDRSFTASASSPELCARCARA